MAQLDLLVKAMDVAIWEMGEAFTGMPDEDLWTRPHPRLLSVGELACHVAYGEAQFFLGGKIESPLVLAAAGYYPTSIATPFSLPMTAEAMYEEVKRVHEICKAAFVADPQDSETMNPNHEGWTWGKSWEYQGFHVAYHTGQIYSVRHLLGHETVNN